MLTTELEEGRAPRPFLLRSDRADGHRTMRFGLPDRQHHDGQRRIFIRAGAELRSVRHEDIRDIVTLPPFADHTVLRFFDMRAAP